jgi:hypothetical protein
LGHQAAQEQKDEHDDEEEEGDKDKEDQEKEEEEEEDKGPKKPSWADMARKSMEKPASPPEPQRSLPKRVAQVQAKARGPPPAAGATASVTSATSAAPATSTSAVASTPAPAPAASSTTAVPAATSAAIPRHAPAKVASDGPSGTDGARAVATDESLPAISSEDGEVVSAEATESSEKPKEKGPPSWADRLKNSQSSQTLARPKKGPPSKVGGSPTHATRAPWAKAEAVAKSESSVKESQQEESRQDAWDGGSAEKPDVLAEAKKAEVEEEEDACEMDDPFAMMGGMGEEEVYKVTLVDEATVEETKKDEDESKDDDEDDDGEDEEDGQDLEEEDVDDDVESASTPVSAEEKIVRKKGTDGTIDSASLRLASELGKPDANGIIKYPVAWLKSMADAPGSQGSCPPNIPACLRNSEDGEAVQKEHPAEDRRRYKLAFLKQFKEKATCQELPANHRIPKDIRAGGGSPDKVKEDDWRTDAVKYQSRMKESREKDRNRDGKKGRHIERRQEEALVSSENSWALQQQALKQEADSKVVREMKSILNKLTIEKFDKLYQKLLECGIETQDHIEKLMGEVFDKATTQHHFISMYTDLCIKLNGWVVDRGIVGEDEKTPVSFKRILLNQCQDSFEKYLKKPEGFENLEGDDLFEAKLKYKTKMLGNVKFVGQLLINKVLSSKIIFSCCFQLLEDPSEEKLETLCAFLNTIGPAYDHKEWKSYNELSKVFMEVKALSSNTGRDDIPPRIKFLLKDVVDLRNAGWDRSTRPISGPEGPMRMADVKKQWDKDNAPQERRDKGGRSAPAPLQDSADDEWATVGKARLKQATTPNPRSSSSLASPTDKVRPSTTRAETASNSFGLLDSPQKKKDKKDKKEDTWRREAAPSTPSRSEWKPRILQAGRPELDRSTSAPTEAIASAEEPSLKECQSEV